MLGIPARPPARSRVGGFEPLQAEAGEEAALALGERIVRGEKPRADEDRVGAGEERWRRGLYMTRRCRAIIVYQLDLERGGQ